MYATSYAAFTPDTCSADTSCIHLNPLVSLVAVYMYPVSATKLLLTWHYGDMYPLVSGYKLLVRILHIPSVNAALDIIILPMRYLRLLFYLLYYRTNIGSREARVHYNNESFEKQQLRFFHTSLLCCVHEHYCLLTYSSKKTHAIVLPEHFDNALLMHSRCE